MREHGFNLGGEQSGHIILLDHCTTGDGLVTALQILAIKKRSGNPVSLVCRRFEPVPQILKNVRLEAGHPLTDASVARVIEDGREKLGKDGRLVVRASGTEPLIRVMGEGDNRDFVERIVVDVCAALSASALAA
jgi:phosphoglucosamine mutase